MATRHAYGLGCSDFAVDAEAARLADDLHARTYPDVAACALRALTFRCSYGAGPHHAELRRLGLATIGPSDPVTLVQRVEITDLGRRVASALRAQRIALGWT